MIVKSPGPISISIEQSLEPRQIKIAANLLQNKGNPENLT